MSLWKMRSRSQPDAVSELQPDVLKNLIALGGLGPDHELQPPGWTTWLPLAEGAQVLNLAVSPAANAAPSTPPSARSEPMTFEAATPASAHEESPSAKVIERSAAPGVRRKSIDVATKTAQPTPDADASPAPPASPSSPLSPAPVALAVPSRPAPRETAKRPTVKKTRALARPTGNAGHSRFESSAQPPRRRAETHSDADDEELEMTSMIDMTFLLLIFFMVTSTVSAMGKLELPSAVSGGAENPDERVVVVLDFQDASRPAEDDRLTGSHPVDESQVRLFIQNRADQSIAFGDLESTLKTEFAQRATPMFVLQAHRRMPARLVQQAMKAAERAGAIASMVGVAIPRGGP